MTNTIDSHLIFFLRDIAAPTNNNGNNKPHKPKRGVATRYSDIGIISIEDITRNIDFFKAIDKHANINEVIMKGQNKKVIDTPLFLIITLSNK